MPNHYGNTLICQTGDGWYDDAGNEPHEAAIKDAVEPSGGQRLLSAARPLPAGADPRAWWGTKWDVYDGRLTRMEADGSPPLITFNTAWGPPNAACRQAVREWLAARGVIVHLWIGSDPYDSSTAVVEDWTGARK